jgi:hypothetical protein
MNPICESTHKVTFFTQSGAHHALAQCRNSHSAKRHECRVYRCPFCHHYHLTSVPHIAKRVRVMA